MSLEQSTRQSTWNGTVPNAFDLRVIALVIVAAGFAASVNVPYGGLEVAIVAFGLLVAAGTVGHLLGQRRVRRVTAALVDQWAEAGGQIEDVTRSSSWLRTEWLVHTPEGPVAVGGIALVPISRVSITWRGTGDSLSVSDAEDGLETLADDWYDEVFAGQIND
ncbi:hypothetical protein ACLI4Q_12695 [Natrialbaceae archaeon A-CW1-1]